MNGLISKALQCVGLITIVLSPVIVAEIDVFPRASLGVFGTGIAILCLVIGLFWNYKHEPSEEEIEGEHKIE